MSHQPALWDAPAIPDEPKTYHTFAELQTILEKTAPCRIHYHDRPTGSRCRHVWMKRNRREHWIEITSDRHVDGRIRGYKGLYALAHEVGHALDHERKHPLQHMLKGRRTRHRAEQAAASYALYFAHKYNILHSKTIRRWIALDNNYVMKYTDNPDCIPWDAIQAAAIQLGQESQVTPPAAPSQPAKTRPAGRATAPQKTATPPQRRPATTPEPTVIPQGAYLTITDYAAREGITRVGAYKRVNAGTVPHITVGKMTLVRIE